jgi:hypothetical protein
VASNSTATLDAREVVKNQIADLTHEELYQTIDDKYVHWVDTTAGLRNEWRLTNMFAQGYQWVSVMPSTNRILQTASPRDRRRVTLDLIGPWLMDTEAKLHITLPTFDVTPNTLSQENKDAAVGGEAYGQHLWRNLEMLEKYDEIVRMCEHFGHAFGVLDWDETIGPMFSQRRQDGDGNPVQSPSGPVDDVFTLGDLRFDVLGPNNVITDELPTPMDDKPYVILAQWMSLDNIRATWDEGHKVVEETRARAQDDIMDMAGYTTGVRSMYRHSKGSVPGAIVFRMYMLPQRGAEKGLVVEYANKTELHRTEWPEQFNKMEGYPVVKFDWYRHPLTFRGRSPIMRQIPIQREINTTISQVRESMDVTLAVKWLVPFGSGVDDIDDISGQIVDYLPGLKPEILQPQGVPTFVIRYLQDLMVFMEDVQMLHKPSKGKVPAGVKSGVGIELLQEQDDRPLSVPETSLHGALDRTFRKALQITSVAVSTERMISYVGPNKRRQVLAFKGADLRDNTNIHLQVVGGSSKSKAGIIKRIMEFVQLGMYRKEGGGVDTKRVMEMIRQAHPDVLYEDEDRHVSLQQDENDILWDANQPIPIPQEWERHDIHLPELEEEMNMVKWKTQAQANPEWARRWIAHRELHIQIWMRSLQRDAQRTFAAQSAPPPEQSAPPADSGGKAA